jgi:hypothetical protein
MAQVLYLKDTQDRKYMTDENQAIEEYKRNCEYHRLLRKYCGPNAYSVFTALVDRANDKEHDGWAFPSYEQLMEDTGMGNRNAITTALEILFDLGLIEWQLNGRHAIYKPVKKVNSTELILFQERAEQYQTDTKDSIKTVRSIVSKRYSNVYQSNVNQVNELTTPKGVAAPPQKSRTIDLSDYPAKEPQPEEQLPMPSIPTDGVIPGPATDKGRAGLREDSKHIPSSPQLDLGQEVKGFEAEGGERDMTHVGKARDKPGPKPKAKEPDPRSNHPAIKAYQDVFGRYPKTEHYQAIIDTVGDDQDTLIEWREACTHWMLSDWNRTNTKGLLNCFENGSYKNVTYTSRTYRGRSSSGPGKDRAASTASAGKISQFKPDAWSDPKNEERIRADWRV